MLVGWAVSHMGWRQRNNQLAHKQVPWHKWGSCHAVKRTVEAVAHLDTIEAISYSLQQIYVNHFRKQLHLRISCKQCF